MALQWFGPEIQANLDRAAKNGIDRTMAACVGTAKKNVPVVTSILQGSIRLEPAEVQRGVIIGQWGSFDIGYALSVETGGGAAGDTSDEAIRLALGRDVSEEELKRLRRRRGVRRGQGRNFLRRAADQHYPELEENIRREFLRLT